MKSKNHYGARYRRRHGEGNSEYQQHKAAIMTDLGPHVRPNIPGDGAGKRRRARNFARVHGRRMRRGR